MCQSLVLGNNGPSFLPSGAGREIYYRSSPSSHGPGRAGWMTSFPFPQVPGQRGLGPSLLPEEEQRGTLAPEAGPWLTCPRGRPGARWRLPAAELSGPGEGAAQQPEGWPV